MNQSDNNVKIKDYDRSVAPPALSQYAHHLNHPQTYPNSEEQRRMLERFQKGHWKVDSVLKLDSHKDRMYALREDLQIMDESQRKEHDDIERHRLAHLDGIVKNIAESRNRFHRRTEFERPGALEAKLGDGPLYKIINDGTHIKY